MKTILPLVAIAVLGLSAAVQGVSIPTSSSSSFDRQEALSERWKDLQAVLPHATRLPSEEGKGKHVWQTPVISPESIIATKEGQGYLLPLVVTPPTDKHLAMAVFLSSDPDCVPAAMLSPEGGEIATVNRLSSAPLWLEDEQWPTGCRFGGFWVPARDLIPGKEHVLLFACRPGAPAGIRICVTFLPTEPASYRSEWLQISDYLGLAPVPGERMADMGKFRSARVMAAFPALAPDHIAGATSLKKLVPGALSLGFREPSEAWQESGNIRLASTEPRGQRGDSLQFATAPDACPSREDVVKLVGEPLLSVKLDDLLRHSRSKLRKAMPSPQFSTTEFESAGIQVEYYDVLALLTNDASPPKVVGTWLVGEFAKSGELAGHQTFLLPGTRARAFFNGEKCVGLVGSFGTDEAERLMDSDPPAGNYLEKTPRGETFATFEHDGKSGWRVFGDYPGGKPRFQYRVERGKLSGDVELWRFGGAKMERKSE